MTKAPLGAIHNGRISLERLTSHYDFTAEDGRGLEHCPDYTELVRCFNHLVEYVLYDGETPSWKATQ